MSEIMRGVLRMPPELWGDDPLSVAHRHARYVDAADTIDRLQAEFDALRAEVSALQSQVNAFYLGTPESRLLAMTKERDALRADAERYRWLRSDVATAENYPIACMRVGGWLLLGDELDAAIDAAREWK